jgi:hypothetical protein
MNPVLILKFYSFKGHCNSFLQPSLDPPSDLFSLVFLTKFVRSYACYMHASSRNSTDLYDLRTKAVAERAASSDYSQEFEVSIFLLCLFQDLLRFYSN